MTASKPGLADLKRLRKADQASRKHEAARKTVRARAEHKPVLSEDDARLFRQAVGGVQPLKRKGGRVAPAASLNLPPELLAARRERATGEPERVPAAGRGATVADTGLSPSPERTQGDKRSPGARPADGAARGASSFLRGGHGPDVLRDLRKGRWPVQASLDLHGCTLEDAHRRLQGFLKDCLDYGARCVRVVHGVGYGSPDGVGVLGPQVRGWLADWEAVIAYAECSPADGGQGALRVLLRARQPLSPT